MKIFPIDQMLRERLASNREYHEFLREPSMSCGVYVLAAGSVDRQRPHKQDELYYVLSGAARMTVGNEDREIGPGDTIFVKGSDFLLEGGDHSFRIAYSGVSADQVGEGVSRLAEAFRELSGATA